MVGQHDNGLPVGGDLHRPGHNTVGENIRAAAHLQRRARQLAGHTVTVRRQGIDTVDKILSALHGKGGVLRAGHGAQQRQHLRPLHAHGVQPAAHSLVPQGTVQPFGSDGLPQRGGIT